MFRLDIKKRVLQFKAPAGTSRGTLFNKPSWFIILTDTKNPEKVGYGECSLIPGLSCDDRQGLSNSIMKLVGSYDSLEQLKTIERELSSWPAIRFALETAILDIEKDAERMFYDNSFTRGESAIAINGLIWMGDIDFMKKQLRQKLETGWNCIKIKIGAIEFEEEFQLIQSIRKEFNASDICIRVDANGAFDISEARIKLDRLAELEIHSIEQPIAAGQKEEMAILCQETPLPIALDEEMIGVNELTAKEQLLDYIKPQFIILKPSLLGGLFASEEWITAAEARNIDYWVTSALESNIGLNVIAQWTSNLRIQGHQGLGTGSLFTNNFDCPLLIDNGKLWHNPDKNWNLNLLAS